jgi:hypothetical protein
MLNTFEGGELNIASTATTTISSANAFVDLTAGTWTASDLQHFDSPAAGQLRNLGNTPIEYKVVVAVAAESSANNIITVRVTKWDSSASAFVTVKDQSRQVNDSLGGIDLAFFTVSAKVKLDQNDYIKLQVANTSGTANVTAQVDSFFIIEER